MWPYIIIVVGNLVSAFGGYWLAKHTEDKRDKQYESIRNMIYEIKMNRNEEDTIQKIPIIEKEIEKWADNFLKEKESKKLELKRKEIDDKQKQLTFSKTFNHIYGNFFDTFKTVIEGYNSKAKTKIKYEIPLLPENFYSEEMKLFLAYIIFPNRIKYNFWIDARNTDPNELDPPKLLIQMEFSQDKIQPANQTLVEKMSNFYLSENKIVIMPDNTNQMIALEFHGKFKTLSQPFQQDVSFQKFYEQNTQLAKELIELGVCSDAD
jgi:hypothetical protein